ncbi:MAG: GNAT family N-acetyltransferase [Nitrospiria bacterium]
MKSNPVVRLAEDEKEIQRCYPVMSQLRPNISRDKYLRRIQCQMKQGYLLSYLECRGAIVSVSGFRLGECLAWGKYLYVEDFVTDQGERSKGNGHVLFNWLISLAKTKNCEQIHLDSGVQRFEAHSFYFRQGMKIASHHFSIHIQRGGD